MHLQQQLLHCHYYPIWPTMTADSINYAHHFYYASCYNIWQPVLQRWPMQQCSSRWPTQSSKKEEAIIFSVGTRAYISEKLDHNNMGTNMRINHWCLALIIMRIGLICSLSNIVLNLCCKNIKELRINMVKLMYRHHSCKKDQLRSPHSLSYCHYRIIMTLIFVSLRIHDQSILYLFIVSTQVNNCY